MKKKNNFLFIVNVFFICVLLVHLWLNIFLLFLDILNWNENVQSGLRKCLAYYYFSEFYVV